MSAPIPPIYEKGTPEWKAKHENKSRAGRWIGLLVGVVVFVKAMVPTGFWIVHDQPTPFELAKMVVIGLGLFLVAFALILVWLRVRYGYSFRYQAGLHWRALRGRKP